MIHFLASERHARTIRHFLSTWGKDLAHRITVLPYERIFSREPIRFSRGTYIFQNLGGTMGSRFPPSPLRRLASTLHGHLVDLYGPRRVLNDPVLSTARLALLQALHERGINGFAAYPAGDAGAPRRFPVFVRPERGSKRDTPVLFKTREEYAAALGAAGDVQGLLAVELCDTADAAGIYRKYGCFIVGGRIVPRHVFFSRSWWVKEATLCTPEMLEEELAFLESDSHAEALLEVSRVAGIGYGRIDYALLDGKVQVWEINHTPMIAGGLSSEIAARAPVHRKFVDLFSAALDAIDPDGP